MFGRKERKMEGKKKLKGKKIEIMEKKMLFLDVSRYIGRKENEEVVKLQFTFYILLFCSKTKGKRVIIHNFL